MGIDMIKYLWAKLMLKMRGSAIKNSVLGYDSKIESGSHFINSTMGKYSFCGYNCFINNCEIGSFCSIAGNVVIGGGSHPLEWISTSPVFYNNRDSIKTKFSRYDRDELPRTYIGNDVWIGDGVHVKAGVRIGTGAVIGMGSVVTKDIEPYSIVAGVPAKLIRRRFDDDTCQKLLEIEWWNMDEEKLKNCAVYVKEPSVFIREVMK
ncbi:MAG: CatB-related O-acetyltransferase [Clostridiaceae bacterium]|nr:CatB-related O-acetyltransferase [Clostridiaceae bacterium]